MSLRGNPLHHCPECGRRLREGDGYAYAVSTYQRWCPEHVPAEFREDLIPQASD